MSTSDPLHLDHPRAQREAIQSTEERVFRRVLEGLNLAIDDVGVPIKTLAPELRLAGFLVGILKAHIVLVEQTNAVDAEAYQQDIWRRALALAEQHLRESGKQGGLELIPLQKAVR